MRLIKHTLLFLALFAIYYGFGTSQEISANPPSGFFEVGTDHQIGNRWVRFINGPADMSKLAAFNNSNAIFIFTANIDMTGSTFSPINNFTGIIYGFGHTISNLRFTGNPLIANSSNGVIEWLNFENIQIINDNSLTTNGLLVNNNSGIIRNISYSVSNNSQILRVVPPLVHSSSNGLIENIMGQYNLNINHTQSTAQPFTFNSIIRDSSSTTVRNTWIRGDINVSRAGVFTYFPMPSNVANQSSSRCADTINVNVVTHGSVSVNLNNCFYSNQDRVFDLAGQSQMTNYVSNRLLPTEQAFVDFYQSAQSPVFPTSFWNVFQNDLRIAQNGRLSIAGQHPLNLVNRNGSSTTVNLYRTPFFNSSLLPYSLFTQNSNPVVSRVLNEEVQYSTNYSRVIINGESAPRNGIVGYFRVVTIQLESDYQLPTLTARINMQLNTNLRNNTEVSVGFTPTTSLGAIFDQNGSQREDMPLTTEGEYIFRIRFGNSKSAEYKMILRPIISGILSDNNVFYNYAVTPIITASSVLINNVTFLNDRSFTEVGHYDVSFPNLTSSSIRFSIEPSLNFSDGNKLSSPRPITISKNIQKLFINDVEINETFVLSNAAIITETEDEYRYTPAFGKHTVRVEGINGFDETYEFEVEPQYSVQRNALNGHLSLNITGAILLIDNVTVPALTAKLTDVGNYQIKIKIPNDSFVSNPGQIFLNESQQVGPIIETALSGFYQGSVTPNIKGSGMSVTLNNIPISLSNINKTLDAPGTYVIVLAGKGEFTQRIQFQITLTDNIIQRDYYAEVPIKLSAPNNFIRFSDKDTSIDTPFDYSIRVRAIGTYDVFTTNSDNIRVFVKSFEIKPMDYDVSVNNYVFTLNVNQLHPDVRFFINQTEYNTRQNIRHEAAGRYNVRFERIEILDDQTSHQQFGEASLVIEPRFSRSIIPVTSVVESYRLLNSVQTFTLNGRVFQGSQFNENNEFLIRQNGENIIIVQGVNGELFTYTSIFENPHYNNMQSLLIPTILFGVISALSLALRFLGVYRNES